MRTAVVRRRCNGSRTDNLAGHRIDHRGFGGGTMLAGGTVEWIVGSILVKSFVVFGLGFAAEQSCEQAGPCIAGLIVVASVIVAVMRGNTVGKGESGISTRTSLGNWLALPSVSWPIGTYGLRWILAAILRASSGKSVTWVPVIISKENRPTTTKMMMANTLERPQASGEPRKKPNRPPADCRIVMSNPVWSAAIATSMIEQIDT